MPLIAHNFVRVRYLFATSVLALLGALFLIGALVWSFSPFLDAYALRSKSEFLYSLFYKLPLGPVEATSTTGVARSIPVLLYHGEGSDSDLPTSVFVQQMRALKADGWQTITLEQFDQWEKGKLTLPDKSFLLTFDDGRKDTYYNADPVLEDVGYNAVMFVITGFSLPSSGAKSDFYLNQTELTAMQESGRWELESHGDQDHRQYSIQSTTDLTHKATTLNDGHFLSNKFWETSADRFETDAEFTQRIRSDLTTSKQILENDFNSSVIAYAYPFNDFGEDTVNFPGSEAIVDSVVPSIYSYAFYQTWDQNGDTFNYPETGNGPDSETYMVKRIEPDASWSGQDLITALDEGRAKDIPYTSSSFADDWVTTWGSVARGQALTLTAASTTSGASTFLNGSNGWTNYLFTVQFTRTPGTSLSLLARNTNDRDYVRCAFSDGSVDIETNLNDEERVVAHASGYDFEELQGSVGVGIYGSQVVCYVGATPIVSAYVAGGVLSKGGIGISIWNKNIAAARATVSHVSVSSFSGAVVAAPLPAPVSAAAAPIAVSVAAAPEEAPTNPISTAPPSDPPPSLPPQVTSTSSPQASTTRARIGGTLLRFMNASDGARPSSVFRAGR